MRYIVLLFGILLFSVPSFSQHEELRTAIEKIIKDKKATVGVGVIFDKKGCDDKEECKDSLTINNDFLYPTMSTYKFYQAMAVLDYIDGKYELDHAIWIAKNDLKPNTYSPLRDDKPEGNYYMTLSDLIKYSVSQSDNNACDILFKFIGGTEKVDEYMRSIGLKNTQIAATEDQMHQSFENQYLNWSKPFSAACALEIFRTKNFLAKESRDFLWQTMVKTSTGANKIKALLPENTIVAHKTGSSSRDSDGLMAGDNDIAIIQLPNGHYYSLAVFVANSMESDETNAQIIADISKAVYDYLNLN